MTLRVASVAVGIDRYPPSLLREEESPLRYASIDARCFHDYVCSAWSSSPPAYHRVLSEDVELRDIEQAFAELGAEAPFDLVLVFLSGHGRRKGDGGILLTAGAEDSSLDGEKLSSILGLIAAERLVLILDACYAEAILHNCLFFTHLEGSRVRLFLASSRADQRSWEDDELEQSIFVFHFLNLLTAEESNERVDRVVESEIFLGLRARIAEDTFRRKNARQEPVWGGIASEGLALPLVTGSQAKVRLSRPWEVARRAIWRAAAATGTLLIMAAFVIHYFFYYVDVTSEGFLGVRSGVRSLTFLTPGSLSLRVETPIRFDDLVLSDAELARLQRGIIRGRWQQSDAVGRRRWGSDLVPALDERAGLRWSLIQGDLIQPGEVPPSGLWEKEWSGRLLAEAQVLGRLPSPADDYPLDRVMRSRQVVIASVDFCNPEGVDSDLIEFAELAIRQNSAEVLDALDALANAARSGGSESALDLEDFMNILRTIHYRAQGDLPPATAIAEASSLAALLEARAVGLLLKGLPVLGPNELDDLLALSRDGCDPWPDYVLSGLADSLKIPDLAKRLLLPVAEIDYVGSLGALQAEELLALDALGHLARRNLLTESQWLKVTRQLTYYDDSVSENIGLFEWLIETVPGGQLPRLVVDDLFRFAREWSQGEDPSWALPPLAVLASAADQLSVEERQQLERLAREVSETAHYPSREYSLLWGHLGRIGISNPEALSQLLPDMEDVRALPPADLPPDGSIPLLAGQVPDHWLLGLSLMANGTDLVEPAWEALSLSAERRPNQKFIDEVYRGLLAHPSRPRIKGIGDLSRLTSRIRDLRKKALRRGLEIELLAFEISSFPYPERSRFSKRLYELWGDETEPEVKASLAELILSLHRRLKPSHFLSS